MTQASNAVPGFRIFRRIHRVDQDIVRALSTIGVGDLSDCMRGMGVMDSGIRAHYSPMPRLCGTAVTVDLSPGDGLLLRAAITTAQPGDVIVANGHGVTARAVLGGAVAMHMVHQGVKGLVVDGAVRDIAEFCALGFPVMARAVTPRSGSTAAGWGDVNVPIACGGVVVSAGDVIVGDEEGVVVVPRLAAAAVVREIGRTGHAVYDPASIRQRLAELTDDAKVPGSENLRRALKERRGVVIESAYEDCLKPEWPIKAASASEVDLDAAKAKQTPRHTMRKTKGPGKTKA